MKVYVVTEADCGIMEVFPPQKKQNSLDLKIQNDMQKYVTGKKK